MRLTVLLLVCGLLAVNAANINLDTYPFKEEIEFVNSLPDATWKAGRQVRFEGMTEKDIEYMCGVIDLGYNRLPIYNIPVLKDVPAEFDSRTQWPQCTSIGEIRDQSNCGSCWAFGAVESMSDRYCILMNMTVELSASDMMDCCRPCGNGCEGGFPSAAWEYWVHVGVCTGGLNDQPANSSCKPYPFKSCEHHISGQKPNCSKSTERTPHCEKKCEAGYSKSYKDDLHFGKSAYSVSGVEHIQTEIMTNGPVEASFEVYADFPSYKSGVYKHIRGRLLGGHAVKILGWGVEGDMPYWNVANSWNPDWGDKGYFKILRGKDECGIEGGIAAGLPKS